MLLVLCSYFSVESQHVCSFEDPYRSQAQGVYINDQGTTKISFIICHHSWSRDTCILAGYNSFGTMPSKPKTKPEIWRLLQRWPAEDWLLMRHISKEFWRLLISRLISFKSLRRRMHKSRWHWWVMIQIWECLRSSIFHPSRSTCFT